VTVVDANGRTIADIYRGFNEAGEYRLTWNAVDLASGIYFIRLHSGDFTSTIKTTLLK
jgi:hypothetical protein